MIINLSYVPKISWAACFIYSQLSKLYFFQIRDVSGWGKSRSVQDLFEFEARVQNKVPATYSNLRIKLQELSTILIA